jgi:hypothetical protein
MVERTLAQSQPVLSQRTRLSHLPRKKRMNNFVACFIIYTIGFLIGYLVGERNREKVIIASGEGVKVKEDFHIAPAPVGQKARIIHPKSPRQVAIENEMKR